MNNFTFRIMCYELKENRLNILCDFRDSTFDLANEFASVCSKAKYDLVKFYISYEVDWAFGDFTLKEWTSKKYDTWQQLNRSC